MSLYFKDASEEEEEEEEEEEDEEGGGEQTKHIRSDGILRVLIQLGLTLTF